MGSFLQPKRKETKQMFGLSRTRELELPEVFISLFDLLSLVFYIFKNKEMY